MSAAPNASMVEIAGVTFRYGERIALRDVSLSIPRGTVFGLLGPNGGGKTTLFRILATLVPPMGGTARIAGFDVALQQELVRQRIGVVFQHPSLDGKLTVLENVMHHGMLYGITGGELTRRGMELLERFSVADRAKDRVDTLSGGLKRRVELAKCLLNRPQLLLLDEPSTGLDPGARLALMAVLHELRDSEGVTSLLTTHLMDEADGCEQLALLNRGALVAADTPDGLKSRIGGDVVTVRVSEPEAFARQAAQRWHVNAEVIEGAVRIERERGHEFVPELAAAFPGLVQSITVGKPTLEDVFIHLTGRTLAEDEPAAAPRKGRHR